MDCIKGSSFLKLIKRTSNFKEPFFMWNINLLKTPSLLNWMLLLQLKASSIKIQYWPDSIYMDRLNLKIIIILVKKNHFLKEKSWETTSSLSTSKRKRAHQQQKEAVSQRTKTASPNLPRALSKTKCLMIP